jgi:threonylcarbamoyladenosine tRNA methylthiotransferase MtaB
VGERASIAFLTLGCKVNQTESDAIADALGVAASREVEDADVVVINTCTVTGEADHKARKSVRHALGLPKQPAVVVTGCLAALDADGLRALSDRVVVEADKSRVPQRVRQALGDRPLESAPRGTARRARVQLKVEDGCDAFCTYCIVPYARGLPRAVPLAEIERQARSLATDRVSEVVLTGINIGRYRDGEMRLGDVVRAVAEAGIPRVRVSSIEPGDVTDDLLGAVASLPAFCRHLHVPLQSGSDAVLARMGRPYDTRAYAATLSRVREALPGMAITTDVIVGFPEETDAEFAETRAFVEAQQFSRLHVFRYSPRPGTPAAEMPGQVPAPVKAARAAALRELGERLHAEFAATMVGQAAELLVERIAEQGGERLAEGTTREYLRLAVRCAPDARAGDLVEVIVEAGREGGGPCGRLP